MNRHLTTHDITWFLEAARNNQLDLDPPYQRRSVWTRKDRQFFIDTIFRNYPSPAIFLHKTLDENGRPTFHVVDGKQRIQTVLEFVDGRLRIPEDFGDARLNDKRWPDLRTDTESRNRFWNYKFVVEEIDFEDSNVVNDVFDRINRNARKLTRQELRHAKFDGWFITQVEAEARSQDWRDLAMVTQARERRMADTQFLSELMLIVLERQMRNFDQDGLDDAYAEYDDISAEDSTVDEEGFAREFARIKKTLIEIENQNEVITTYCRAMAGLYTVWAVVALEPDLPPMPALGDRLRDFMRMVTDGVPDGAAAELKTAVQNYAANMRGASTDIGPRRARYDALSTALKSLL